jgi:hypothetical protein
VRACVIQRMTLMFGQVRDQIKRQEAEIASLQSEVGRRHKRHANPIFDEGDENYDNTSIDYRDRFW